MNRTATLPLVRRAEEVEATGEPTSLDRFLIEAADSAGSVAVVEHRLGAAVLAAPLHRHSREDEYTIVLEGRLGVVEDGAEVFAGPGDVVFKRRGRWHTFWNAGDRPLRVLELITPAGLEECFRRLAEPGGEYEPSTLAALVGEYGCLVDFDATMPIMERHRLHF